MKIKELIVQLQEYDPEWDVTYLAALEPSKNHISYDIRHIYIAGGTKKPEIILSN